MRILFLIAVAALAGCSSQPRSSEALESLAEEPAAAATAAAPVEAAAVAQREDDAFEPPPGYKPTMREGQQLYCRKVVVLGSRFPKQICMTQAQLEEHERGNQAMRDDMSQHIPQCTSGPGCGSR